MGVQFPETKIESQGNVCKCLYPSLVLFNSPIVAEFTFLYPDVFAIPWLNFISIPNNFTFYFDKLLENHQIKIRRYMSGSYIKSYFDEYETDLSMMANKLNNGLNINEVQLVSKSIKNRGFFEKFFQLFS